MAIDSATLGLALSGGGFRATLFGLGTRWRLNDALRKRWLISEFEAGRQRGAYWGIGTRLSTYGSTVTSMTVDSPLSQALEHMPTRLRSVDAERQGHLINWGSALCDVSLRWRVGLNLPMATTWPVPEYPL